MNKYFNINYTALFLGAVFVLINLTGISQTDDKTVKLVFAETVKDVPGKTNTTQATGHVHFQHNNANLYCDSAIFFRDLNRVHAYGKVHINQGDTINLFCDSLRYDGNTKISKLGGNVRMRDQEYKLVTDSLEYNGNNSVGAYTNFATITTIKDDIKLTSIKGYYHAHPKTFYFKDSVRVSHPNYQLISDTLEFRTATNTAHFHGPTTIKMDSSVVLCSRGIYYTDEQFVELWNGATLVDSNRTFYADSMRYSQKTGVGEGFMNVDLYDSTEQVQFLSNYMWKSAENDTIILQDMARIIQYNEKDTLELLADSIFHVNDSLDEKTSIAQNEVGIINGDISVRCDSAYFATADSIIKLFKNPIMWSQNTQLSADSILSNYYDNKFHEVYLYHNSFIANEHDSIHYDQIKGKFMTAWIDSNKMQKVKIELNAKTLYFTEEETPAADSIAPTKKVDGMNDLECNEIMIYFKESEIDRIAFIENPTAVYLPINKVKDSQLFLKGFNWQIGLKPKSIFLE